MQIQKSLSDKISLSDISAPINETFSDRYGENFQTNLLKSCILDTQFWSKVFLQLNEGLFSRFHGYVFNEFANYFTKYNHLPPRDAVISKLNGDKYDEENKKFIIDIVDDIYSFSEKTNQLDYYKDATKEFVRDRNVREAFIKCVDLYKKGDYKSIPDVIAEAVKEVAFDQKLGLNFLEAGELLSQSLKLEMIPTPFEAINNVLKGGLARKELGLILGGTSAGKSWMLQAIGAHALLQGYNVLYYTLEMSDVSVARRFASIIQQKSPDDVTEQDILKIKDTLKSKGVTSRLFITEYPTKSCSVSDLKLNMSALYNYYSFKPDLILIDYADLMKSRTSYSEKRHELTSIYEDLRGLGGESNAGVWTVSQVNRTGYGKKIITVENIAEDFNKSTICDFIMSVGRDIANRIGGHAQAFIAKNRRGKDALKFNMDMRFDEGIITMDVNPTEVNDVEEYRENKPDIRDDRILENLIGDLDV